MVGVESVTLWVHIAAGVVALLAGVTALATEKGGQRHRRAGRAFVLAMAMVVGTVIPLLVLDPSTLRVFLTLVAVFSGYLAFSGYRVLSRRRPDGEADIVDWVGAVGVVTACVALAAWGGVWLVDGRQFGVVMLAFGGIGSWMGGSDVWTFRSAGDRDPWIVTHLQRMLAALIATVSAVSAVNLTGSLGVLAWLWPTIVGTPIIVYYARQHQ